MKKLIFFVILAGVGMIEFHRALQDGSILRFLDEHPNPLVVPTIEYYMGGGYYIFRDLENAATYYIRIPTRYPNSPLADDADWEYLQSLDDSSESSRALLADEYAKYIELFPKGNHLEEARNKMDGYKSGAR